MKCTYCGTEGSQTLCLVCGEKTEPASRSNGNDTSERPPTDNRAVEQHGSPFANNPIQKYHNTVTRDGTLDDKIPHEQFKSHDPNNGDKDNSHSDDSEEYITCDSGDVSEGSFYEADEEVMQSKLIYSRQTLENDKHIVDEHTIDINNSRSTKLQQTKTIAIHSTNREIESQTGKYTPVPNIQVIKNSNTTHRTKETKNQTTVDTFQIEPIVPAVGITFGPVVTRSKTKISETLVVRFHVYVSIEMMSKPEDRFYIRFGYDKLGGWNSLKHEMKKVCHKKKYKGKCFEYEYSIPIQRMFLKNGIVYKYVVVNLNSKKEHWEKYRSRYNDNNRILRASGTLEISNGFWHQYDGIVLAESGLLQKALNFFVSDKKHLAVGYLNDLIPELFTRPMSEANRSSIKTDIEHCSMLFDGVLRVYVTDMGHWQSTDEFHREVTEPKLADVIDLMSRQSSNQRSEDRVLQALSAVVLCQCFKIVLKRESWEHLCECLLLSLDDSNQHVVEIDSIRAHFGEVNIQEALVYIVNCFIKYSKSAKPSWLLCMPLLHITSGICTPFSEPNWNIDIQSEKWWGTEHVQDVAYETRLRNFNHEDIIRKLKPLYKMDCYLSRSIARTINAQDHHVLISDLLSLESACAISLRQKQLPYKVSATKQIWMEEAYRNVNIRLQSKLDDRERTHIDNTSEQMTANSNTVCSMTKLEGEVNVTIQIAWLTSAALMPCTFKQGKRTAESYATVTSLKDSESTPVMPVVLRNWLPKVRNTSMQKSNIKTTKTYYKEYSGDNYFQCFGDDSYYNYSEDEYEEQDDEYTDSEDDCCFDIDDAYSNVRHSSKTKFANILDDDTYNEFANWHSNKRFYYERNDDFRDRHVDVHYNDRENGYSNKTRYGDYYNRIENYEAIDEDDYDYEDYDLDHMFVKYIADTTSEDSFKSWESYSDEDMFGEHEEQYYFVRDYSLDEEAYEKPFEEDSDW